MQVNKQQLAAGADEGVLDDRHMLYPGKTSETRGFRRAEFMEHKHFKCVNRDELKIESLKVVQCIFVIALYEMTV